MSHEELLVLLQRQWAGEISPEQLERLEAYLQGSPEHAAAAAAYRLLWEKAALPAPKPIEMNLDEEFGRLMARLEALENQPSRSQRLVLWWSRGWKVAAAVLLLGGAVWFVRQQLAPAAELKEVYAVADKHLVALPDGSQISLRQGARLRYEAENYGQPERRVRLEGEAFFTVEHHPKSSFVVETASGFEVEVLGTEFDVRAAEEEVSVLVSQGRVRLWPQGKGAGRKNTDLISKQKATWSARQPEQVQALEPDFNEIAWHTRRLSFDDAPLSEVALAFSAGYGINVEIASPEMRACAHSGNYSLDKSNAEQALQAICRVYGCRMETAPGSNQYRLVGGKCPTVR